MLSVRLEENECYSAWVMGDNTNLEKASSDLKCKYCYTELPKLPAYSTPMTGSDPVFLSIFAMTML